MAKPDASAPGCIYAQMALKRPPTVVLLLWRIEGLCKAFASSGFSPTPQSHSQRAKTSYSGSAVVTRSGANARLPPPARTIWCRLDQILDQHNGSELPWSSAIVRLLPRNSLNNLTFVHSARQTEGDAAALKSACRWFDSAPGGHLSTGCRVIVPADLVGERAQAIRGAVDLAL
jgi:hypothetical protein